MRCGRGGRGVVTTMLHKRTKKPCWLRLLCLFIRHVQEDVCLFDVQQHEARSQMFMTFASMPKALVFTELLPLYYTTC